MHFTCAPAELRGLRPRSPRQALKRHQGLGAVVVTAPEKKSEKELKKLQNVHFKAALAPLFDCFRSSLNLFHFSFSKIF